MLRRRSLLLFVLALAFSLSACTIGKAEDSTLQASNDEGIEPVEFVAPVDEDLPPVESKPVIERRTIQLETGEVSIALPSDWEIVLAEGTSVPYAGQTYDLKLLPPSDEKVMGIITIGSTLDGHQLSTGEFYSLYSTSVESLLPEAVEDTAEYVEIKVNEGNAVYAILTNASLVGKSLSPDEYLFLTRFFANYKNGIILYASLLSDDLECESYKVMLDAVASVEASFYPVNISFNLKDWEKVKAAPLYDLDNLDLTSLDLSESEYLMEYVLESVRGGERYEVPVITAGEFYRSDIESFVWVTDGIGMIYALESGSDVMECMDYKVSYDIQDLIKDGFILDADLPLRVSADYQSAVYGLSMDLSGKPNAVYIYLLQNIPDTDHILSLLIILFPNHWSNDDSMTLAELNEYIGVDLAAYWPW